MKRYLLLTGVILITTTFLPAIGVSYAQKKETFDVITYVAPKGWKKTSIYNVLNLPSQTTRKAATATVAPRLRRL